MIKLPSTMRVFILFVGMFLLYFSAPAQTTANLETGYASYLAAYLDGNRTAYGEVYDKNKLTAAHRIFPLGTLIKVTREDNGKSIIVRINDRGPVSQSRIIDLSYAAAEAIDLIYDGVAMVGLQVVDKDGKPIDYSIPQSVTKAPSAYQTMEVPSSYDYTPRYNNPLPKAAEAQTPPAAVTSPPGTATKQPTEVTREKTLAERAPKLGVSGDLQAKSPFAPTEYDQPAADAPLINGYYVQLGAFSQRENAQSLRDRLAKNGIINVQIQPAGQVYKTLVGPFQNATEAKTQMSKLAGEQKVKGFVVKME